MPHPNVTNWSDLGSLLGLDLSAISASASYDITNFGAVGNGVADDALAVTAILAQLPATGGTIQIPRGNWTWSSVPALPPGITGRLRIVGLPGAKVTLTASAPRFLDFARTADYQTFQNIEISDLLIDCNNIGGKHHIILGNYVNGSFQLRMNYDQIAIRRVKVINAPTDHTAATNHRLGVFLYSTHAGAGEGTATSVTNILAEDVRVEGGNFGVGVGVSAFGGVSNVNGSWDNVSIRRCYWAAASVPSAVGATGGFQIGSTGHGGTAWLQDSVAVNSADVGFEVNSATHVVVRDCVSVDAFQKGFLHQNFDTPSNPGAQRVIFQNCQGRRYNTTAGLGYLLGYVNTIPLGEVVLRGCSWHKNQANIDSTTGEAIRMTSGVIYERLVIEDFDGVSEGWTAAASPTPTLVDIRSGSGTYKSDVSLRDLKLRYTGTVSSGTATHDFIKLTGTFGRISLDGLTYEENVTGMNTNGCRAINVGDTSATTVDNVLLRRIYPRSIVGDAGPRVILIGRSANLTVGGRIDIMDCDFSNMAAGAEVSFAVAGQNVTNTYFLRNRWRVYPKPSAALGTTNFVAGTFTTAVGNQYIGGSQAVIQFLGATGAGITAIDVSKDGTTYENVWTQASGALTQTVSALVDNGDFVKVTFATTQPITRVAFLK